MVSSTSPARAALGEPNRLYSSARPDEAHRCPDRITGSSGWRVYPPAVVGRAGVSELEAASCCCRCCGVALGSFLVHGQQKTYGRFLEERREEAPVAYHRGFGGRARRESKASETRRLAGGGGGAEHGQRE